MSGASRRMDAARTTSKRATSSSSAISACVGNPGTPMLKLLRWLYFFQSNGWPVCSSTSATIRCPGQPRRNSCHVVVSPSLRLPQKWGSLPPHCWSLGFTSRSRASQLFLLLRPKRTARERPARCQRRLQRFSQGQLRRVTHDDGGTRGKACCRDCIERCGWQHVTRL